MSKQHQLTLHLLDGTKDTYSFISESDIDSVRETLLHDIADDGVIALMTEDKRLLLYPLASIIKISVSNVDKLQECTTCFIKVTSV